MHELIKVKRVRRYKLVEIPEEGDGKVNWGEIITRMHGACDDIDHARLEAAAMQEAIGDTGVVGYTGKTGDREIDTLRERVSELSVENGLLRGELKETHESVSDKCDLIAELRHAQGDQTARIGRLDDSVDTLKTELLRLKKVILERNEEVLLLKVERDDDGKVARLQANREAMKRVALGMKDQITWLEEKREEDADAYRALSGVYGKYQIETDAKIKALEKQVEEQTERLFKACQLEEEQKKIIRNMSARIIELRASLDTWIDDGERGGECVDLKEEVKELDRQLKEEVKVVAAQTGRLFNAFNEIDELQKSYVPQKNCLEMLKALKDVGYGKHGATNTLWGMVMEITKDVPHLMKERDRATFLQEDGDNTIMKLNAEIRKQQEMASRSDACLVAREREIKKLREEDCDSCDELQKEKLRLEGVYAMARWGNDQLKDKIRELQAEVKSLYDEVTELQASQLEGMEREGAKKRIELLKERDDQVYKMHEQIGKLMNELALQVDAIKTLERKLHTTQGDLDLTRDRSNERRNRIDKLLLEKEDLRKHLRTEQQEKTDWMKEADKRNSLFRNSENLIDDILRKIGLNSGLRYNLSDLYERLAEICVAPSVIAGLKTEVKRLQYMNDNQKSMVGLAHGEREGADLKVKTLESDLRIVKGTASQRMHYIGNLEGDLKVAHEAVRVERQDRIKWQSRIEETKSQRRAVNARADKIKAKLSGHKHATASAKTEAKREKRKRKAAEKVAMQRNAVLQSTDKLFLDMLKALGISEGHLLDPKVLLRKLEKYGEIREWYGKLVRATERDFSSRIPPPEVALERIERWRRSRMDGQWIDPDWIDN